MTKSELLGEQSKGDNCMNESPLTLLRQSQARRAVTLAHDQFQTNLDYSEESVRQVDAILDRVYAELEQRRRMADPPISPPTRDEVWELAVAFGAYLGEVVRRTLGINWIANSGDEEAQPLSMAIPPNSTIRGDQVFPAARVFNRLTGSPQEDLWSFYESVKSAVRFPWKIEYPLSEAAMLAEARHEAFLFAIKCKGDSGLIEAELNDWEEMDQQWQAHPYPNENPMHPGSGPSIYRDAYLAALQEARRIILELTSQ